RERDDDEHGVAEVEAVGPGEHLVQGVLGVLAVLLGRAGHPHALHQQQGVDLVAVGLEGEDEGLLLEIEAAGGTQGQPGHQGQAQPGCGRTHGGSSPGAGARRVTDSPPLSRRKGVVKQRPTHSLAVAITSAPAAISTPPRATCQPTRSLRKTAPRIIAKTSDSRSSGTRRPASPSRNARYSSREDTAVSAPARSRNAHARASIARTRPRLPCAATAPQEISRISTDCTARPRLASTSRSPTLVSVAIT